MSNARFAPHSSAWVAQTWIAFVLSVGVTGIGIAYLPEGAWVRAFLAMGLLFTVGSTLSLAKTTRDVHEATRPSSRTEDPAGTYR
jgi:hypothetical protein